MGKQPKTFVAIHLGAGYHSVVRAAELKKICNRVCATTMDRLRDGLSAVDAVELAITQLEDEPVTNAGYGSNLNNEGFVECDASIIDGFSSNFGAVGALPDVKNPISVAKALLSIQQHKDQRLVPPMILTGLGAYRFAANSGLEAFEICTESLKGSLVSEGAINQFQKHCEQTKRADTVGAIVMDVYGNFAAGASSGGVAFKLPGRIGQAAHFGAGCWAQNSRTNLPGVASCTTGTGEALIRSLFAKTIADCIIGTPETLADVKLSRVFEDTLQMLAGHHSELGMIAAVKYPNDCLEIWYGHTTSSMVVGFMTDHDTKPKCCVSEKSAANSPFTIGGGSL